MQELYYFVYAEDEAWLNQVYGYFTALRYSYVSDNERFVVLIPFCTPQTLHHYLAGNSASILLYGCVSMSAAINLYDGKHGVSSLLNSVCPAASCWIYRPYIT